MGNGYGGISVHGLSRRTRSSIFLAGLAMAVLVAVLPAFADTPETGSDPGVTLTVTPADGLSDGQLVTVTGTGFPPNTVGTIRECAGSIAAPQCDLTVTAAFVTTANGDIPPTSVRVERIIDTGTTTFNCGVQNCALVASAGGRTSQHHIRMAGAGTLLPTSSTSSSSTVPTTVLPTTVVPTTVVPPATIVPGTVLGQLVCPLLRSILQPFPFLQQLITSLLGLFACPVAA